MTAQDNPRYVQWLPPYELVAKVDFYEFESPDPVRLAEAENELAEWMREAYRDAR